MHGGVAKDGLGKENLEALQAGLANLARHVANVRKFGVPAVVAINQFVTDTQAEHDLIRSYCQSELGVEAIVFEFHVGLAPSVLAAIGAAAADRHDD